MKEPASYPTWIIAQKPGEVPTRKGPFYKTKHIEDMLRDLYRLYPGIICIVIYGPVENDWWPDHGYAWLDVHGDRRRRHPRKDEERRK